MRTTYEANGKTMAIDARNRESSKRIDTLPTLEDSLDKLY